MTEHALRACRSGRLRSGIVGSGLCGLLVLLNAGCAAPKPAAVATPTPTLPLGIFWSGGGWNVERYFVADDTPASYYCVASVGRPGSILAIMEVSNGTLAWGVSGPTSPGAGASAAQPAAAKPSVVDLAFEPGPTLSFNVAPGSPGYLVSVRPTTDPVRQEKLARAVREANAVSVSGSQVGKLGRFDLTRSAAALEQLDFCAKSGG